MRTREPGSTGLFLLGAGLLLAVLVLKIISPFLTALLAAASAALLLAPANRALASRHPAAAAAGLTALVSLAFVAPFFLGVWKIASEAGEAYPAARAWLEGLALPGVSDAKKVVIDNLEQVSSWTGMFAKTLIKNAAFVLLNFAMFTASLFLFLRDGPRMIRRLTRLIPLPEDETEVLLFRVRDALLAVVNGIFVIALLQGGLAWAGFALFHIPFAVLLGALCMILSPVPFIGTAFVWVPVVLYTFFSGAPAKAAALGLWFGLVVGVSDNLVRPILLGSRMKLPIPLLFIAVIGAMKIFGFAGLFIGPLAIALTYGYFDIVRERSLPGARRGESAPAAGG